MARKNKQKKQTTIALISDVHGNLPALEAVLDDAAPRDVAEIWNLGDMLGYAPFPNEVLRRLKDIAAVNLVGNYDLKVLDFAFKRDKWKRKKPPVKFAAFQWNDAHLTGKSRRFVELLPEQARRTVGGLDVLMVHGSPASIDELLNSDTPEDRLRELIRVAAADVVVCGHSHEAFVRKVDGVWFVNPGSVGRPEGGDWRASYAVLRFSDGELKTEHFRIPYDINRVARGVHAAGLPKEFIDVFRKGKSLDQLQPDGEHPGARHQGDADSKLPAVLAFARSCRYEREHTEQVTRLALSIFDALKEVHHLGSRERFWLQAGSLLHDIGWTEGPRGHHKVAMDLIMSDAALPFDREERQMVALIARYHRKALPAPRHKYYENLGDAQRRRVCVLAGILRVADGLDRSHDGVIRDVRCRVSDHQIVMTCDARGPAEVELAAASKKGDLFTLAFERRLVLKRASRAR